MKRATAKLLKNEIFIVMMNGVFAYTAFCAIIMATLNVPPDVLLDSNMVEVIKIFEG